MKISLCTTSMNRLGFLQQTFLKNICDNDDYDQLEFVLLNYNSSDDMDEWVRDCLAQYIRDGRVVYIHEQTATHFRPAHSRNVAARMASGDVVCNVDADTFTAQGFAKYLYNIFSEDELPRVANSYDIGTYQDLSTHGRIAMRKWHFMKLGGYDESFIGWGAEDSDLNRRCLYAGFIRTIILPEYIKFIDHDDVVRVQFIDFSPLKEELSISCLENKYITNEMNRIKSETRSGNGSFVANFGKTWGKAIVTKNFEKVIELRTPWIKQ